MADTCGACAIAEQPTLSAGIAIVHYKEDLRFALDKARQAVRPAKDRGGDAVEAFVARRSGEHVSVFVPFTLMERVISTIMEPFALERRIAGSLPSVLNNRRSRE